MPSVIFVIQCTAATKRTPKRLANDKSRLSAVHKRAPGVISVDAKRVMSTIPQPKPNSFSRSISSRTSAYVAWFAAKSNSISRRVRIPGQDGVPQASSPNTSG